MAIWNKKQSDANNTEPVIEAGNIQLSESPEHVSQPDVSQQHTTAKTTKFAAIAALSLILVGIGLAAVYYKVSREVVTKNPEVNKIDANKVLLDKQKALGDAKENLVKNPNDTDSILLVAENARDLNPDEAKKYYAQAFENYKEVNGLYDTSVTKIVGVYWGAAGLAERAGNNNEAIKYYKLVVDTADTSDGYDKHISEQSQVALKRLK